MGLWGTLTGMDGGEQSVSTSGISISFDPACIDITVYAGGDYGARYRFLADGEAVSLAGYGAQAGILVDGEHIAFTTAINLGDNTVDVVMARDVTKLLPTGTGTWDLFIVSPDGKAMPYVAGKCRIKPTATEVV